MSARAATQSSRSIGLWRSERALPRGLRSRRWVFLASAGGFLVAHCAHAALIFSRVQG